MQLISKKHYRDTLLLSTISIPVYEYEEGIEEVKT